MKNYTGFVNDITNTLGAGDYNPAAVAITGGTISGVTNGGIKNILNQGTADDAIETFASDDVAHGMTEIIETNIYGYVSKAVTESGGLAIIGLSDADTSGVVIQGIIGSNTPTSPALALAASKKSGTTDIVIGDNEYAIAFYTGFSLLGSVKGNGSWELLAVNNTPIGGTTPAAGAFTTLKQTTGAADGAIPVSDATGAFTLTASTGSGAPVRATSPTLETPILGTPTSGTLTNCTGLPVAGGGTGASTAQAAINTLTAVAGATNEHVLTKDTATGNAIFKAAAGGTGTGDMLLGTAQTVTASKTFGDDLLILAGSTSGTIKLNAADEAGTTTVTFPATTGTVQIAGENVTVGAGKTLDVSAGTLTLADNQISGDKVEGGTIAAVTVTTLTSTTANITTLDTNVAAAGVTLSGTTLSADGTDENISIAITPKGTGEVDITKVDIDGGAIDGTTIGETTPGTIRGLNKEIYKTENGTLTAAECSGTIVSNYGMTDADCTIDLPTAEEGLAFVCILPAVRAKFFKLHCPAAQADKIYLSGVAGSDDGNVGVASGYATGASCSMFTFKASDGGFDWMCIPLFGTWVAS